MQLKGLDRSKKFISPGLEPIQYIVSYKLINWDDKKKKKVGNNWL
jgi:hypothetical protein